MVQLHFAISPAKLRKTFLPRFRGNSQRPSVKKFDTNLSVLYSIRYRNYVAYRIHSWIGAVVALSKASNLVSSLLHFLIFGWHGEMQQVWPQLGLTRFFSVSPRRAADVTASQLDAQETGPTSPVFSFVAIAFMILDPRNHSARLPPAECLRASFHGCIPPCDSST